MAIAEKLLMEFDQEMKSTRAVLARVPDADASWKPHPKSSALGDLAFHVAWLVTWSLSAMTDESFDFHPPGGEPYKMPSFTTTAALLEMFDQSVAKMREALSGMSDAQLLESWTLASGGKTLFTMPRAGAFRFTVMNHLIHHRGQLTVYLRMRDVPLPAIYGPTADEPW